MVLFNFFIVTPFYVFKSTLVSTLPIPKGSAFSNTCRSFQHDLKIPFHNHLSNIKIRLNLRLTIIIFIKTYY